MVAASRHSSVFSREEVLCLWGQLQPFPFTRVFCDVSFVRAFLGGATAGTQDPLQQDVNPTNVHTAGRRRNSCTQQAALKSHGFPRDGRGVPPTCSLHSLGTLADSTDQSAHFPAWGRFFLKALLSTAL